MTSIPNPDQPPKPDPSAAKVARQVAKYLKQFLREHSDQIWQNGTGEKFGKIEAWQFAANCYGLSPIIRDTKTLFDIDGQELGFHAYAYVIDHNGLTVGAAEAICLREEPDWRDAPSHQLLSMAQTRAAGKAMRLKIAFVMALAGLQGTPAEEMSAAPRTEEPKRRKGETDCADCSNGVSAQRAKKTQLQYHRVLCITCEKAAYPETEREIQPVQEIQPKPAPFPCGPDCTNPEHAWHEAKPTRDPQKVLNFADIKPGPQPVAKILDKAKDVPYAL
jgi:hypothetical protein